MSVNNKVLVCTGFHRSATSVTANYLQNASLPVGKVLMGGNFSNKHGHYEDWPVVEFHDELLKSNGTSWQFHDEVCLDDAMSTASQKLNDYICMRDRISDSHWGFKDPRACLFLPMWDSALKSRGRFIFLLRHWSSCINSLLSRHSLLVLMHQHQHQEQNVDLKFWSQPTLAAKMWLAYNYRVLTFLKENPDTTLPITQRALFEGLDLPQVINDKFALDLDESAASPCNKKLLSDKAMTTIVSMLPKALILKMDTLWTELLSLTTYKTENENAHWVEFSDGSNVAAKSLSAKLSFNVNSNVVAKPSANMHVKSLEQLVNSFKSRGVELVLVNIDAEFSQAEINYHRIMQLINKQYEFNSEAQAAIAQWLMLQKQWNLAKEVWHWCLSLKSVAPYMYYNLGLCYEQLDNKKSMNYFLDLALDKNPNNPSFWFTKARVCRLNGQIEKALDMLKRATELAPQNLMLASAYYDLLEQENRLDDAEFIVLAIAQYHPDHQQVKNLQSRLAFKKGDETNENFMELTKTKLKIEVESDDYSRYFQLLKSCGSQSAEKDLLYRITEALTKADIL